MEGVGVKGLACQKIMDGKASNGNVCEKAVPSCCLKALACVPEEDAKCHSTVVSGWFSEPHPRPGHINLLFFLSCHASLIISEPVSYCWFLVLYWMQGKKAKRSISITLCGQVGHHLISLYFWPFVILLA